MNTKQLMIYGAYGYTGELIAREAVAQNLHPILAGRNAGRLVKLAGELDLYHRAFDLAHPQLEDVGVVLNCAGPFSATAAPMMQACLQAKAHYIDITGEIDVFELGKTLDAAAKAAGIVICPGVGFDVIPTDCVALALHQALPDATHLALGFETNSAMSPGTSKTSVEALGKGGKVRRDGKIVTVPMGTVTRRIDFSGSGAKLAMEFPWGDVSTAHFTTSIPNISVFLAVPAGLLWGARIGNFLTPILNLPAVQNFLMRKAGEVIGPDAQTRAATPCFVWGEARNAAGVTKTARIRTANGYDVTVYGALKVAQALLASGQTASGYFTPSLLCGANLIETLPGSGPLSLA